MYIYIHTHIYMYMYTYIHAYKHTLTKPSLDPLPSQGTSYAPPLSFPRGGVVSNSSRSSWLVVSR